MIKKCTYINQSGKADLLVIFITFFLVNCGIVFVYSSSFAIAELRHGAASFFLSQHVIRGVIALVFFFLFIKVDYHILGKLSMFFYCGAAILLFILLLPHNDAVKGARRWLQIGSLAFQVSDFARLAVIFVIAKDVETSGSHIRECKCFIKTFIKILLICGLILLEPNFSTAFIFVFLGVAMLYSAGARISHILLSLAVLIPTGVFFAFAKGYRLERIKSFVSMFTKGGGLGYQLDQSLIGLGHGGLWGVGIGQGEQKYFYLPEPHTDFAFSNLGEEIGFIGLFVIIILFVILVYRGMKIALSAPDRMGQTMAFGISLVLGIYMLVHAYVNTGIIPTTGVPLPFLSYGGVSLIFSLSSIGILINISSQSKDSTRVLVHQTEKKRKRKKYNMNKHLAHI